MQLYVQSAGRDATAPRQAGCPPLLNFDLSALESLQQLAVNPAEAAVAEHHHHVAALHLLREMRYDGVGVRQIRRRLAGRADVQHQFFRIQPFFRREQFQARNLGNNHPVRVHKGLGQFRLKIIPARRVCARLEDGPDFFLRVTDAQRPHRFADGGWMMAEIVNHRHAAGDALDLHASLDALERGERRLDLLVRQTAVFCRADDRERVAHVEFAAQFQMKFETGNLKRRRRRAIADVERITA